MAMKLRKGDLVEVIAGKEKGKQGKILKVFCQEGRLLIAGVNKVKRHTKPTQKEPRGGILEKEAPLHCSNVLAVDPKTSKGGRVSIQRKDGKCLRIFKKTGSLLK